MDTNHSSITTGGRPDSHTVTQRIPARPDTGPFNDPAELRSFLNGNTELFSRLTNLQITECALQPTELGGGDLRAETADGQSILIYARPEYDNHRNLGRILVDSFYSKPDAIIWIAETFCGWEQFLLLDLSAPDENFQTRFIPVQLSAARTGSQWALNFENTEYHESRQAMNDDG